MKVGQGLINCGEVSLDDFFAFLAVGLADGLLDFGDGRIARQNIRQSEKTGLHDGVGAARHAGLHIHNLPGWTRSQQRNGLPLVGAAS